MAIKLELTKERTQRELSEEEWAFPIWRWAAFSLFDTLILVSPLTRELIYPGGSDSRFYLGKSLGNLMLDDTQRFILIIIILTLLLPAFALIIESLLFSKGHPLLSMICSCLILLVQRSYLSIVSVLSQIFGALQFIVICFTFSST